MALERFLAPLLDDEEVRLARVWVVDDRDCPACASSRVAPPANALHLRATGERPAATASSLGIAGLHHLIPSASASQIAVVAARGKPMMSSSVEALDRWGLESTSAAAADIRGVLGYPLQFRGRVVGILVCYLRTTPRKNTLAWLPSFAAHAAVAIGNCRALQAITRLHDQLELERDYLREEVAQTIGLESIVAESEALKRLLRQVDLVAPTDTNVLIQGESGTGKERIARLIHQRSSRSAHALVKVNCASIPKDLVASELFGHVRGAFAGATHDRVGRFQVADRGTLFLDEVGEIPPDLQSTLLRVLHEGDVERVGDETSRHVNVRVIAASRDLRADVDSGRFRLDLFYRLAVLPVQVPPLRERREDVPALTDRFIRLASERLRREPPKVSEREMAKLVVYDWPGNIRELQHVVERAVILAPPGHAVQFDVRPAVEDDVDRRRPDPPFRTDKEWQRLERENLLAALKASGGKVSGREGAAALLGMNPNTLTSRLRALGLKRTFVGRDDTPSPRTPRRKPDDRERPSR